MNAPRDLGPDFREWMGDVPPMPDDLPDRTLEETKRTRQRRRWLWFLPGPKPTAGADDEQGPGRPSAPTTQPRGLLPAPMEGTMTMLSATKLVGLAAIVALVGALTVALPANQPVEPGGSVTSLTDAPSELTAVRGTMRVLDQNEVGPCEPVGTADVECVGDVWTGRGDWDDDRLDGLLRTRQNRRSLAGVTHAVQTQSIYVENDGGSWVGTGYAYQDPASSGHHFGQVLEGRGGYEGLTAILDLDQPYFSGTFEGTGVIVSGELPPMPDPAPTTFEPTDG